MKEEGRLLSQLLDFVVKLFDIELFIIETNPITVYRWDAAPILSEAAASLSNVIALLVVIQPESHIPSLVISPTVIGHGLLSSHEMEE